MVVAFAVAAVVVGVVGARLGVLVGGVAVVAVAIEGVAGVGLDVVAAGVDLGVAVLAFCDNPLEGFGGGFES